MESCTNKIQTSRLICLPGINGVQKKHSNTITYFQNILLFAIACHSTSHCLITLVFACHTNTCIAYYTTFVSYLRHCLPNDIAGACNPTSHSLNDSFGIWDRYIHCLWFLVKVSIYLLRRYLGF